MAEVTYFVVLPHCDRARVLTRCGTDRRAAVDPFATESAREEARMFCDELMEEEAVAPHDLIAA
jgi:hypothetical protein